ncbi:telomerase RNA component interacting RNase [Amia ocellicauda]|uniref:telomerase RNA component interacting RNase n=1 Tax=Amia ocellicauda TaxID=2972642 RepID=UPI0034649983
MCVARLNYVPNYMVAPGTRHGAEIVQTHLVSHRRRHLSPRPRQDDGLATLMTITMDPHRSSSGKSSQSSSSSRHHQHRHSSSSDSATSNSPGSPASPSVGAASGANVFANDGSFLEMFKKKMEEEKRRKEMEGGRSEQRTAQDGPPAQEKKPVSVTSIVGKRRGGAKLALKTGMVAKKQKLETEIDTTKGDAWTKYMAEVKKYKAHQCGDDDKTRPLVK